MSDNSAKSDESSSQSKQNKENQIIDEEQWLSEDNGNDLLDDVKDIKISKKSKTDKNGAKRDSKARTASAAMFFNENKSIAGFGNSMRAVFTSVRELVENSLDAAEKRGVTPNIGIQIRKLSKSELQDLMGTKITKSKDTRLDFIELSCKDNGIGVSRELIPQLFGTVLAGTKYGAQQTRGRFGLGSKMVLLYAMSTLDLPIQITTRPEYDDKTYRVRLFIDLEKNAPIIASDEVFREGDEEHFESCGTEIKVSITGSWNLAKLYVREYFKQLAIITPYADFNVKLPSDDGNEIDELIFKRVVDDLPKPPEVIKIHPWGTDISTFRREMMASNDQNLINFLVNNFMGVTESAAEAFFEEVGVDANKSPNDLTSQEIRRIVHDGFNRALKESKTIKRKRDRIFKFDEPDGSALSPLGANRLRKGLEKELSPDFVEAITRPPRAYEGHPFIIEAAIGFGGGVNLAASSKGVTIVENRVIYRFANRIPLIFGAGSDLITNIVNSMNWSDYGLTRGTDPLAIAVSLVSTKIPFPETSKEYIDKVEEIGAEVKLSVMQLGRKLKTYLGRRRRRQREKQRKSRFERFAPKTVENLLSILQKENYWNPATGINPSRIVSALSSGKPRIDNRIIPRGKSIFRENIWSNPKTLEKLQNKGILEIASFLREDNAKLAKILNEKESYVDKVKRRTITELEAGNEIPELDVNIILDPEYEKRFYKKGESEKGYELPRLNKALSRRWIRNSYDYMISPPKKLILVQGLAQKLFEAEKVMVVENLYNTVSDVELVNELTSLLELEDLVGDMSELSALSGFLGKEIDELIPDEEIVETIGSKEIEKEAIEGEKEKELEIPLEIILPPIELLYENEELKKRKVETILEFLLEVSHPSSPIDEKVLAPTIVPHFKKALSDLVQNNPRYGEIKVSVSSQSWIDGYLRNAFKRRKMDTINDVIKSDDEVLIEIGELQRTLFSAVIRNLIPAKGSINIDDFKVNSPEIKIKFLSNANIDSIEKFISTPSESLVNDEKLWPYLEKLIEESKEKLIESLTNENKMGSLKLLKQIDPKIEEELDQLNINNSYDFLIKPLDYFSEEVQEKVKIAKQGLGRSFSGFLKKQESLVNKINITCLEELVFNPDYFLTKELTEEDRNLLIEIIEFLMLPIIVYSENLLINIDILRDAGVTTLGKFLVWPVDDLSHITHLPAEWFELTRESFDMKEIKKDLSNFQTPLSKLNKILKPEEISNLLNNKIDTLEKASQIKWGDLYPHEVENWKEISKINELLVGDVSLITNYIIDKKFKTKITQLLDDLEDLGIKTILQLIRLTPNTISQKLSTKKKRETIDELFQSFDDYNSDKFNNESTFVNALIFFKTIEKLRYPIVYLSELNNKEIELLNHSGYRTIHQLYSANINDISQETGIPKKTMQEKLDNSALKLKGTPLFTFDNKNNPVSIIKFEREGIEYFQPDELLSLSSIGFDTIESLYYMSDNRTFEASNISWNVINHFKKLLQSPPVLISWKQITTEVVKEETEIDESELFDSETNTKNTSEINNTDENKTKTIEIVNYLTIPSTDLEKLTKNNITRVIDFVSQSTENLSKILNWDLDLTRERQTTVILQEAGIELSELDIFRPDHVQHLNELGYVTIEDLYFSSSEENWDSQIIPWESIRTIKNILHLDLINAKEELGEDIYQILKGNEIISILDFYLTGDPILEQKTGLPAERFENLKYALDIGALIESFDKTVFFAPGINFYRAQTLINNNIKTLLDFLMTPSNELSKILNLQKKEIESIRKGLDRDSIYKTEEERGVLLRDLMALSRNDVRSISKSGIFEMNTLDTLQELLNQINPQIFQGESYLLQKVTDIQKVCTINLSDIGDLNEFDVNLLKKNGILTIADVLIIGYDDVQEDQNLVNSMMNITRAVIDLRPFAALAKLPGKSVILEESEDETPVLDLWLEKDKRLHKRTMRNIRSILSIPIKFTTFTKEYSGNIEDLEGKTVADIILEYHPVEDSPESILQSQLSANGAIINLLKEGSTPIDLLDIQPSEFNALFNNNINTIEQLLMYEEKSLSEITGNTQKFWKDLKSSFDPEYYNEKLQQIGIPISIFHLDKDDLTQLDEYGIEYLDQVLVYSKGKGIIKELKEFLLSCPIFLIGTAGEKEIAENAGATSIIEAIICLREQQKYRDLLKEIILIAWQSYMNKITLPAKVKSLIRSPQINSAQDLAYHILNNKIGKLSKTVLNYIEPYLTSVLYLPLSGDTLRNIVLEYRCSNIVDFVTSPMVIGETMEIKDNILKNNIFPAIYTEISLNSNILKNATKSLWQKIDEANFTLQEIISSPRTVEEYKGVKQRFLQEARQFLKTPISRIFKDDSHFITQERLQHFFLRFEDIIFDLPLIYESNATVAKLLVNSINNETLKIINDIPILNEVQMATETALNLPIQGYHEFYTSTWQASRILSKTDTPPSRSTKKFLLSSLNSLFGIKGISSSEFWELWKIGIRTKADLLLQRVEITNNPSFTKKRYKEIQDITTKSIEKSNSDNLILIKNVSKLYDSELKDLPDLSIATLLSEPIHPLIKSKFVNIPKKFVTIIKDPLILSEFGNGLDVETILKIFELGIYSIADFLVYPEDLNPIRNDLKTIDSRIKRLIGNNKIVRKDFDVDKLHFPKELLDLSSNRELTRFLYDLIQLKDPKILNSLTINLKYSKIPKDVISKLIQGNINSLFLFLLSSPTSISEMTGISEDEVIKLIENMNIIEINERQFSLPLQTMNIENISKATKTKLIETNVYSLLDLKLEYLEGINRSDINTLTNFFYFLNYKINFLLYLNNINSSEISKLNYTTIRDIYRNYDEVDEKIIAKINFRDLSPVNEIYDNLRKLNELEGIVSKDMNKLNKGGIFTFEDILNSDNNKLVELGFTEVWISEIKEKLQAKWNDIIDIPKDLESKLKNLKINNVAELLSQPELKDISYSTPIKVRKSYKLENIFGEKLPKDFTKLGINTISDFIENDKITKQIENNSDLSNFIQILHSPVENSPNIDSKWIVKLKDAKITKIWQYLTSDVVNLSEICSTSMKAQEDYKFSLNLQNITLKSSFKLPIEDDGLKNNFIAIGLFDFDDIYTKGFIPSVEQNYPEIFDIVDKYNLILDQKISNFSSFWEIEEEERRNISKSATSLYDLYNSNLKLFNQLFKNKIAGEEKEFLDISLILSDNAEIKKLKSEKINHVEDWLFEYYKGNFEINTESYKILRGSLAIIPGIEIKYVKNGLKNNVNTISELLVYPKDISKLLGIPIQKIQTIKDNLKNIDLSNIQFTNCGLFNPAVYESAKENGIISWSQIILKSNQNDLEKIKGITVKTLDILSDVFSTNIWYIRELRELGYTTIKELVKQGITSIFDFIIFEIMIKNKIGEVNYNNILDKLSKSSINKLQKQKQVKISFSKKIKVADIKSFEKAGINDLYGLLVADEKSFPGELLTGYNDWQSIANQSIDNLDIDTKLINSIKNSKNKLIADVIFLPDEYLRGIGFSNKVIGNLRKEIPLKKGRSTKSSTGKKSKMNSSVSKNEVTSKTTTPRKTKSTKKTSKSKSKGTSKTRKKKSKNR